MPLKDMIDTTPVPCKVVRILEAMEPEDKATLTQWLEKMRPWPLSQALTKYGYPISEQTVKRHKEGSCSCVRVSQ